MDFFARQNEKIANGTITGPGVHYLHLGIFLLFFLTPIAILTVLSSFQILSAS